MGGRERERQWRERIPRSLRIDERSVIVFRVVTSAPRNYTRRVIRVAYIMYDAGVINR